VRIDTRCGAVTADRVVIATGYATPVFRPLAGQFRLYRTYVLATEPLSAVERRRLGLADVLAWETDRPYHYARWTRNHRLLLGGGDRLVRGTRRSARLMTTATRELRAYFETQFPALARIETPVAWEGLFAMTPDSLPYVGPHRRYPRHWFALGYGGNGMTFGYLAARLLLERWQHRMSDDHALFEFGRMRRTER
jgi:glycine/D-amino acid oxidase-like deaminating enzyme